MSDNVVSLKGASISNARREAFLQAVGASFDIYVEHHGYEPDAIVYTLCGLKQALQMAWHICGESEGGATSVLALAAVHFLYEAQGGDR